MVYSLFHSCVCNGISLDSAYVPPKAYISPEPATYPADKRCSPSTAIHVVDAVAVTTPSAETASLIEAVANSRPSSLKDIYPFNFGVVILVEREIRTIAVTVTVS